MTLRVGDEIAKLHSEKRRSGLMARLVGLAWDRFRSPFEWLAWRLWGRRKAIRRFQELALPRIRHKTAAEIEDEERRLIEHRQHLDSLKVPSIPAPDASDVN